MSSYPVAYEQHPAEKRNRLTVFFRFLTVIPHFIFAFFYAIAFFVVELVAWFAILFTGRFPQALYDFAAGYLRFSARLYGYSLLVVDQYPPFNGEEHPGYPIRTHIAPPQAQYSRVKAFFRLILAIPIFIIQYVFQFWLAAVAIALWLVGVVMGSTPPALTDALRFPISYYVRSNAYVYLMTDTYPSLGDSPPLAAPSVPSAPLPA